jgi:hypothetical protein
VLDRSRKFSPAPTILKTCPSAQAPRSTCYPPCLQCGHAAKRASTRSRLHKCCAAECSLRAHARAEYKFSRQEIRTTLWCNAAVAAILEMGATPSHMGSGQ